MDINKIYNCSCEDLMTQMPNDFVDLVITSPPYDSLRDYNGYSFPFEQVATELYRVVKIGGVVVWVVGDATVNGSETGTSFRQALYFMSLGFNLHDTMIYEKSAASFPASYFKKRYNSIFDYMFVFSKGKPKTANLLRDKKNMWGGTKTFGDISSRQVDGTLKKKGQIEISEYGFRNNIWRYNVGKGHSAKDKIAFKHPAIFPEELAMDHIKTWSNEDDLVYDPFGGSGTTAKMAHLLKRNWIMSEISDEYCDIAKKRLETYLSGVLF